MRNFHRKEQQDMCEDLRYSGIVNHYGEEQRIRPSALGMSDPVVEPLEILEILELETPPYPHPPCRLVR